MKKEKLPDLTFSDISFRTVETPWNLNVLLYRFAPGVHAKLVQDQILKGVFGDPLVERFAFVEFLHAEMVDSFDLGGSEVSTQNCFRKLREFFLFADENSLSLALDAVESTFLKWADSLYLRTMKQKSGASKGVTMTPLKESSAYTNASTVGKLVDKVLDRPVAIMRSTRIRYPKQTKTPFGAAAEKQNLEQTFGFGNLLQDICDGLSLSTIAEGYDYVCIPIRTGQKIEYKAAQTGNGKKLTLTNLRIEAELMMFIGQTGMNLAQASELKLCNFSYESHLDGYSVRDYKKRRKGPVLFEIFKDYRPHFERYLEWRRKMFPASDILFPFAARDWSASGVKFGGFRMRAICTDLGIPYVSPQTLRNTRVNWLLRQSADPDLTAEMAQHTKQTLLGVYQRPSLQKAMIEATHFWAVADPIHREEPVAPGECKGIPQTLVSAPRAAPLADCEKPSGCLWCENHRDVDSLDYVWALETFKCMKIVELGRSRLSSPEVNNSPVVLIIERLNAKISWFQSSSEQREAWVIEAKIRIDEENYHPSFKYAIEEMEGAE